MDARRYTVSFSGVAVTAAVDFFELTAATNKPIDIYGIMISQSSDFGDAQDELLRYKVIRGHTTSGSGGAAPTPIPLSATTTGAGFTAETNNTTIASAGTAVDLHAGAFNVRVGESLWLPEESEWSTSGSSLLVVRLMDAPADSLTMSGTLYVVEYG